MSPRKSFQNIVLAFACLLLANGCASLSRAPKHNSQLKVGPQAQEQIKKKTRPTFVPCHFPNGDMSPDFNISVSIPPLGIFPPSALLTLFVTNDEGKDRKEFSIKLPRRARDVVVFGASKALVSFGSTGEVALVNLKKNRVGKMVKIGEDTAGMCRVSKGRALVADPAAGRIYLFDPEAGSVVRSFTMKGKPEQMRWVIPDFIIEVADSKGHSLGIIDITQ